MQSLEFLERGAQRRRCHPLKGSRRQLQPAFSRIVSRRKLQRFAADATSQSILVKQRALHKKSSGCPGVVFLKLLLPTADATDYISSADTQLNSVRSERYNSADDAQPWVRDP